jgi:hypothetical protein
MLQLAASVVVASSHSMAQQSAALEAEADGR